MLWKLAFMSKKYVPKKLYMLRYLAGMNPEKADNLLSSSVALSCFRFAVFAILSVTSQFSVTLISRP
jgi:hypothetical protein